MKQLEEINTKNTLTMLLEDHIQQLLITEVKQGLVMLQSHTNMSTNFILLKTLKN